MFVPYKVINDLTNDPEYLMIPYENWGPLKKAKVKRAGNEEKVEESIACEVTITAEVRKRVRATRLKIAVPL